MERTFTARTDLEAILMEQALAMARELEVVSDAAPDGQVLAIAEAAAVRSGRELTRTALEAALRRQAGAAERKGLPGRACPCGGSRLVKDEAPRAVVTAAGRVSAARRSMRCPGCGLTAYPADDRIGLDGFLSPGAVRLACLASASWSFDVASERLEEIAGVRIDDETIRRHVHRAAAGLPARREAAPPRGFADAQGLREFLTDGVMAPTRDGWRELKMGLFQARPAGEPAEVAGWADRELPGPTASVAYAAIADSGAFSARWPAWAAGLGINPAVPLTVLADGAAWIWSAAAEHFPEAAQVLDIFHACQHIAAAAAGLYGEGTAEAADWLERGRSRLLADGWPGLLDHVGQTPSEGRTLLGQAALDEMISYFAKHTERLGYFGRLRAGRSIGSGAVEGLARRLGRRLKVPGRGWDVGNIEGMAALIATVDTTEWDDLWTRPAA